MILRVVNKPFRTRLKNPLRDKKHERRKHVLDTMQRADYDVTGQRSTYDPRYG